MRKAGRGCEDRSRDWRDVERCALKTEEGAMSQEIQVAVEAENSRKGFTSQRFQKDPAVPTPRR